MGADPDPKPEENPGEPLFAVPVLGLRGWTLELRLPAAATRLGAMVTDAVWDPGGSWTEARCEGPGAAHRHPAPRNGCSCGLYAWHPRAESAERLFDEYIEAGSARYGGGKMLEDRGVFGVVEAAGRVEVHREGFRAERARPLALVAGRFWPEEARAGVAELASLYGAEVLDAADAAEVLEFCRRRGGALDDTQVTRLLGPVVDAATRSRPQPGAPATGGPAGPASARSIPDRAAGAFRRLGDLLFGALLVGFAVLWYGAIAAFVIMTAGAILFGWLDEEPKPPPPAKVVAVRIDRDNCRVGVALRSTRPVEKLRVRLTGRVSGQDDSTSAGEGLGHVERTVRAVEAGKSSRWVSPLPAKLCASTEHFVIRGRAVWPGRLGAIATADSSREGSVRNPADTATHRVQ